MADDSYANVAGGSLKLKGGLGAHGKVKKKKKDKKHKKDKKDMDKVAREVAETMAGETGAGDEYEDKRTEAQKKFAEAQRKREEDRIMKKATKSHKDKVEELNKYLDSLSEHYDVPKVSWTK